MHWRMRVILRVGVHSVGQSFLGARVLERFLLDSQTTRTEHLPATGRKLNRKVKRDSSLRRFYTIDAKNTSDECNLNSSQLTLEPLRGAVQTRCTQKARIGESP